MWFRKDEWLDRWDLLVSLRESGKTFKEVAEWLNANGYKPPRAKRYYKQLVQETYYSVKDRIKRLEDKGETTKQIEWVERNESTAIKSRYPIRIGGVKGSDKRD